MRAPYAYLPTRLVAVSDLVESIDTGTVPITPDHFTSTERLAVYQAAFVRFAARVCIYCGTELEHEESSMMPSNSWHHVELSWCGRCGWWTAHESGCIAGSSDPGDLGPWWSDIYEGVLRLFAVDDLEAPVRSLIRFLAEHPHHLYEVPPRQLERTVAGIFAESGEFEVVLTATTRDRGRDVVVVDHAGERTLVEVKRRTRSDKTEGVRTVRELLGAMVMDDATHGLIVSTAGHFSGDARQAAASLSERGYHIDLVDAEALLDALAVGRVAAADAPDCRLLLRSPLWRLDTWPGAPDSHFALAREAGVDASHPDVDT